MSKQKSKQQAQNSSVVAVQQATYSGPIPPPAAMEQYERIVLGAANRILAMADASRRLVMNLWPLNGGCAIVVNG